jgi:hypothetical protein
MKKNTAQLQTLFALRNLWTARRKLMAARDECDRNGEQKRMRGSAYPRQRHSAYETDARIAQMHRESRASMKRGPPAIALIATFLKRPRCIAQRTRTLSMDFPSRQTKTHQNGGIEVHDLTSASKLRRNQFAAEKRGECGEFQHSLWLVA